MGSFVKLHPIHGQNIAQGLLSPSATQLREAGPPEVSLAGKCALIGTLLLVAKQVECDVGLALMVAFVPADDVQHVDETPLSFSQCGGDRLELIFGKIFERCQQRRAGVVQYLTNRFRIGDVVVGRAATTKTGPQGLVFGWFFGQTFGGEDFFGDADVRELPGDVSTAWAGTPAEDGLGIGFLFDRIQQCERACSIEFVAGNQGVEYAHRFLLEWAVHLDAAGGDPYVGVIALEFILA